jgi:hypothetical protein
MPLSNWRFKGLTLAALTDQEAVGEVWPTNDRYLSEQARKHRRLNMDEDNIVVPSRRGGNDTKELSVARSAFDDVDKPVHRDKYIKRMLLRGSIEELDTLWREELLSTVIEGAEPRKIARDASTVVPVDSRKGDYPRGAAQQYADKIAERGRIELEMEDYDTVSWDAEKYGMGFAVSDEMVEHAQIDAIARQVEFAGAALENAINRKWLNELVDGTVSDGNEVDTTHSGTEVDEVTAVNRAVGEVENDDYPEPSTLVVHPQFRTDLYENDVVLRANYSDSDSTIRQRTFSPLFGMNVMPGSSGTYNSSTNSWGWSSDGDFGAVAMNPEYNAIFMYQDISTKSFDDPIRDIQAGNARAWFDSKNLRDEPHAVLEY